MRMSLSAMRMTVHRSSTTMCAALDATSPP
jgi:hypothetical protein